MNMRTFSTYNNNGNAKEFNYLTSNELLYSKIHQTSELLILS
jgi:hypothetical protein